MKVFWIVLGMMFFSPAAGQSFAQEGLAIRCRLDRTHYVLGEPVRLVIELTNQGGETLRLWTEPAILIGRSGERFFEYDPSGEVVAGQIFRETKCRWTAWQRLPAGQTINVAMVISAWLDNVFDAPAEMAFFAFPMVGEYRLYARYGQRQSETVGMRVELPKGVDAAAWEKIRTTAFSRLVQNPNVAITESERGALEGVVREFSGSVYAPYVALALGRYYLNRSYTFGWEGGVGDEERDRVRGEHRRKAEEYFGLAARMEQVPWVREEAMLELAKLRGGAEAIRLCEEALQRWPEGFLREEFLRLREAWQRELELEAKFKPPEDGGMRAERELKALGYDLENLTEEQRRFLASEVEGGTWLECEERGLSNEECDELLYRRYKEWVVKNLKPVRGPEAGLRWAVGRREGW
ncbi:MAG: hypothetical protein RMM51_11245 [Verrucomicrobiae bacterium]|nr:hypothetical protein [Verrucomicrobiae bacterium]